MTLLLIVLFLSGDGTPISATISYGLAPAACEEAVSQSPPGQIRWCAEKEPTQKEIFSVRRT